MQRFSWLIKLDIYTDPVLRRRALAAYAIIGLLAVLFLGLLLVPLLVPAAGVNPLVMSVRLTISSIAVGVSYVLLRTGRLGAVTWVLALTGLAANALVGPLLNFDSPLVSFIPVIVILFITLLAPQRGVLLMVVALSLINFLYLLIFDLPGDRAANALGTLIITPVAGVFAYILAGGWERGLEYMQQQSQLQRLRMVELSAEVTQRISARVELSQLLDETVNTVRERFDEIYHAQIFLVDDAGKDAVLRASTGEPGRKLLERGHKLAVGSQSVIGQVTVVGEPVLASDTSTDIVHRANELLPNTRAELALPLVSGGSIIGALDVQSTHPNPFNQEDISTLQALANQIAIAIDNARLFTEQQSVIAQNRRLAEQAQQRLDQIQELNRRLTQQAWHAYLSGEEVAPALTVDFETGEMTPNAAWTSGLEDAVNSGDVIRAEAGEEGVIAVPLNVRGQIVGAMEFELEPGTPLDDEQAGMVADVAERLALALESARLFEEAQRLARREAVINDIGARLQSAVGIENTLTLAAQGLQTALNAQQIAIRLGTPPTAPPANGAGNGGQEDDA